MPELWPEDRERDARSGYALDIAAREYSSIGGYLERQEYFSAARRLRQLSEFIGRLAELDIGLTAAEEARTERQSRLLQARMRTELRRSRGNQRHGE